MAYGLEPIVGSEVDPLSFTRQDEYQGGARLKADPQDLIRCVDQNGVQRLRRKGRLAGGVRDKILMAQMKAGMAAMWSSGARYVDIAAAINERYDLQGDSAISVHAIEYHIKAMLDYWRQKGLAKMDERQAVILARFDQIEALAVEAYFASMEGKKTTQRNKQIERARSKERFNQLLKSEKRKRENGDKRAKTPLFIDTGELIDLEDLMQVTAEKIQKNVRHESNAAGDPKFLNMLITINKERAKILGLYNRKMDDGDNEAAKLTDEQRQARIATILSSAQNRRALQANETMLADPAPLGGFEEVPAEVVPEEVEELDWESPSEVDVEWD
jgi:hypothetical protein